MLDNSIQHGLLEHNVSIDQVMLQVLHSATCQPVRVWSVPTGNVSLLVGLGEVNDVEDQQMMCERIS